MLARGLCTARAAHIHVQQLAQAVKRLVHSIERAAGAFVRVA